MTNPDKKILLKIASLFSVVRGYNILVIVLAQYLAAIFILAPSKRAMHVLLDFDLFILVIASSLTIASGYIINNFYDSQKDLINRPYKSILDRMVRQSTKLQVYFGINFFVFLIAFFVSYRAVLFFSVYIFLIWFYSHKIKKMVISGNLMAALLGVLPFFGILLYYKNFYETIFFHATFLFLLVLIRELLKDLENQLGDLANDYNTIPVVYSEKTSKKIITLLSVLTIVPVYFLINIFDVGYMDIYFYVCFIVLIFMNLKLWKSTSKPAYLQLHNTMKTLILTGVFCIVLINPKVLLNLKNLFF